jgi:hypothetical protein
MTPHAWYARLEIGGGAGPPHGFVWNGCCWEGRVEDGRLCVRDGKRKQAGRPQRLQGDRKGVKQGTRLRVRILSADFVFYLLIFPRN